MAVSQTIATIPPAPSRADPANFVERHEAVLDRLETLPPEMNTWRDQVNSTQSQINASELQAGQSATAATNAASLALTYSNAEQYAAGTTYAPGETTIGSNGTAYRRLNTSAAGDNPVTSTTGNWTPAITALGAMSTFDLICRIAGMQPTLYLNFKEQDYRHYSSTKGLEKKALADILTFTRGSDGGITNARSQYEALSTNEPRLDFDPVTGVGEGLLVEESRTNLLTYSEDFSNADWVKTRATVAANAGFAPDGTLTADKLVATSPAPYITSSKTLSSGTYTLSFFVKQIGATVGQGIALHSADPDNGVVSSAMYFNDGTWQRYSHTFTFSTAGAVTVRLDPYGDGSTDGIYIWGAQLEEGSFPTSYIPTTTAAATRAADVASITGTTFSDFYRQDEGTFLFRSRAEQTLAFTASLVADPSNRITFGFDTDSGLSVRKDGVWSVSTLKYYSDGRDHTCALAASAGGGANAVDGAVESLITPPQSMPSVTDIYFGIYKTTMTNHLNGHIKYFVYFPKRLPNAAIQQLSALGA